MLHGEEVHVEESIDAVCQASFLCSIKFGVLNVTGDTFLPTNLCQAVCFCKSPGKSAYDQMAIDGKVDTANGKQNWHWYVNVFAKSWY